MASKALRCRWRNCPTPKPFRDDKTLFEHINDTHNGRPGRHPDFVCKWEGCKTLLRPSSISSRSHRARHIIVHTGYQPFVCERDGCGATFRRKEQDSNHAQAHSRGEASDDEDPAQPVRCKTCQKTFSRNSALNTHMGSLLSMRRAAAPEIQQGHLARNVAKGEGGGADLDLPGH